MIVNRPASRLEYGSRRKRPEPKSAQLRVANKEYPCEVGCGHVIARGESHWFTPMRLCVPCFKERYEGRTS